MGYFALKRKVRLIAEGIETAEKLAALSALAVPHGQAYLLGSGGPRTVAGLGRGRLESA